MMRKTKYKVFHQMLSIILCVVLVLGCMPVSVSAAEEITYVDASGTIQSCVSATEVTGGMTTWSAENATEAWYVVTDEVAIDSRVTVTGDVHLILMDDVSLTVHGGIGLSDENSNITIYGQAKGTGQLTVIDVDNDNAGIGGNSGEKCGSITIHGGVIDATGGECGAGIGSGSDGSCGNIAISGGKTLQ